VNEWHYRRLLHSLESVINLLKFRSDSSIHQVALEKLLEYYCICQHILRAESDQLSDFLKSVSLHRNYHDLSPNHPRIEALMGLLFQAE
jgi:endonuclease III